jgi:hypothetical protein
MLFMHIVSVNFIYLFYLSFDVKMVRKGRSMLVMLFIVMLLSPSVSPFLTRVSSSGQQPRVLMYFYHGGWDGYYPDKTISGPAF